MTRKKDTRPRDKKLAPISDSLPLDVQGQPLQGMPVPDVHVAVSPEAIDQQLDADTREFLSQVDDIRSRRPRPDVAPVPAVVLPVGKRGDKGFVWELDAMWTERVERMAQVAGLTAQGYLDSLLRRAWIGLDQRHRGKL